MYKLYLQLNGNKRYFVASSYFPFFLNTILDLIYDFVPDRVHDIDFDNDEVIAILYHNKEIETQFNINSLLKSRKRYCLFFKCVGTEYFVASLPFEPTPNCILSLFYEYLIFNDFHIDFDMHEVEISIQSEGYSNYFTFKNLLEYTK